MTTTLLVPSTSYSPSPSDVLDSPFAPTSAVPGRATPDQSASLEFFELQLLGREVFKNSEEAVATTAPSGRVDRLHDGAMHKLRKMIVANAFESPDPDKANAPLVQQILEMGAGAQLVRRAKLTDIQYDRSSGTPVPTGRESRFVTVFELLGPSLQLEILDHAVKNSAPYLKELVKAALSDSPHLAVREAALLTEVPLDKGVILGKSLNLRRDANPNSNDATVLALLYGDGAKEFKKRVSVGDEENRRSVTKFSFLNEDQQATVIHHVVAHDSPHANAILRIASREGASEDIREMATETLRGRQAASRKVRAQNRRVEATPEITFSAVENPLEVSLQVAPTVANEAALEVSPQVEPTVANQTASKSTFVPLARESGFLARTIKFFAPGLYDLEGRSNEELLKITRLNELTGWERGAVEKVGGLDLAAKAWQTFYRQNRADPQIGRAELKVDGFLKSAEDARSFWTGVFSSVVGVTQSMQRISLLAVTALGLTEKDPNFNTMLENCERDPRCMTDALLVAGKAIKSHFAANVIYAVDKAEALLAQGKPLTELAPRREETVRPMTRVDVKYTKKDLPWFHPEIQVPGFAWLPDEEPLAVTPRTKASLSDRASTFIATTMDPLVNRVIDISFRALRGGLDLYAKVTRPRSEGEVKAPARSLDPQTL